LSIIDAKNDINYRHLHLRGAVGISRTEVFDGRTYTVVPVVALMEGVIFAVNADVPEYVPLKTLMMAPQGWNGRPVVLDHPSMNGRMISANTPGVLERKAFGVVFNTRVVGAKLLMEAWLDPIKAASIGEGATDTVIRAAKGTPVEVSVGVYATVEDEKGTFNGKAYKATWVDMIPDHLALLSAGEIGACSNAMGCGVRTHLVTAKGMECPATEECPVKAARRSLRERVVSLLRDAGDQPGHDFHGNQYTAAQQESVAKIKELENEIRRIHATVSGNRGVDIRKRLALTKHLQSELKHHQNIVDPKRTDAVVASAKLVLIKGERGDISGYEIHHEGQHIGTIKRTTFQDFKTVNGALQMTRGHGFNAHHPDGTLMVQNLKRDQAVRLIAENHSRKLRGAMRAAGGPGSGRWPLGSHMNAAESHGDAARAHDVAAKAKQSGNGNYETLATEARVASIAAEHGSLATRDIKGGSLAGRARTTGAAGDHVLAANLHERAMNHHYTQVSKSKRLRYNAFKTRAAGGYGSGVIGHSTGRQQRPAFDASKLSPHDQETIKHEAALRAHEKAITASKSANGAFAKLRGHDAQSKLHEAAASAHENAAKLFTAANDPKMAAESTAAATAHREKLRTAGASMELRNADDATPVAGSPEEEAAETPAQETAEDATHSTGFPLPLYPYSVHQRGNTTPVSFHKTRRQAVSAAASHTRVKNIPHVVMNRVTGQVIRSAGGPGSGRYPKGSGEHQKGDRVEIQSTHWNKASHGKTGTIFSSATSNEGHPTHWVKMGNGGEFVHAADLKPVRDDKRVLASRHALYTQVKELMHDSANAS
jgi:hypothetical protein